MQLRLKKKKHYSFHLIISYKAKLSTIFSPQPIFNYRNLYHSQNKILKKKKRKRKSNKK